jgi:hypothetical protein
MEGAGGEGETACLLASIARVKTRVAYSTKLKLIDVEEKGEEAEEERKEGETKQN